MRELTLKELQLKSLDVLREIHRFCVENGLKYSLAYGTMIGAIRHKGFIPWDDDIDIFMPRPDYDKLCRTYRSDRYVMINRNNRKDCMLAFARICDAKETCFTTFTPWLRNSDNVGVWVDIFPLDSVSDDAETFESSYMNLRKLHHDAVRGRKALRRLSLEKSFFFNLNTVKKKLFSLFWKKPESYVDEIIRIDGTIPYGSTGHVAQLAYPGIMARYEKSDIDSYHLVQFGNEEFFIADGYDRMLRTVYGDYMQLPPENERAPLQSYIHFYWKEK